MSSIDVLEDRLAEIEGMMISVSIEIKALGEEAAIKLTARDARIIDYNGLDEEIVEMRESIAKLKGDD